MANDIIVDIFATMFIVFLLAAIGQLLIWWALPAFIAHRTRVRGPVGSITLAVASIGDVIHV